MKSAFVSVVIPTYNREGTIVRAIQSVQNQTYQNFEIIVVDDASTDHTREVIEGLKDDRIRYIRFPRNRGAGAARNTGVRAANGEYIAFQDSDDEWMPEKLEKQLISFEMNKEAKLCYTRFYYEEPKYMEWPSGEVSTEALSGEIFDRLLFGNLIGGPTIMIRKECLEERDAFVPELRALEDYEFVLRIAKKYKVSFVNELLVKAHYTEESVSKNIYNHVKAGAYLFELYKKDYIRCNIYEQKKKQLYELAEKVFDEAQLIDFCRLLQ